jgi:hypothetical protein
MNIPPETEFSHLQGYPFKTRINEKDFSYISLRSLYCSGVLRIIIDAPGDRGCPVYGCPLK